MIYIFSIQWQLASFRFNILCIEFLILKNLGQNYLIGIKTDSKKMDLNKNRLKMNLYCKLNSDFKKPYKDLKPLM